MWYVAMLTAVECLVAVLLCHFNVTWCRGGKQQIRFAARRLSTDKLTPNDWIVSVGEDVTRRKAPEDRQKIISRGFPRILISGGKGCRFGSCASHTRRPFSFSGRGPQRNPPTHPPLPWLERWPSIETEKSQLGVLFGQTGLFGLRGGGLKSDAGLQNSWIQDQDKGEA